MSFNNSSFISKLPDVKTTIFTIMGKLANDYNAINLSQGFPDFVSDPKLIALVTQAMSNGQNQYNEQRAKSICSHARNHGVT